MAATSREKRCGAGQLMLAISAALGLAGCHAIHLAGSVTGTAIGTTARIGGDAIGAASSAIHLDPRGVVRHARNATVHAIDGAESVTKTVLHQTTHLADSIFY